MTPDEMALVPTFGRNRPLVIPLVEVVALDIDSDRKAGGVRLSSRTSRVVLLGLIKEADKLAEVLHRLGASVEHV